MARGKWIFGAQQSANQGDPKPGIVAAGPSADARKFGLENFGNTCYANSVIQALYFCTPFRDLMIQAHDPSAPQTPRLLPNASPPPPLAPIRRKPERKGSVSGPAPADGTPPQSHGALQSASASSPVVYTIPSNPPTLFSALRSLFLHISTNPAEKGTVAPRAFIDKLKEMNELFRSTMHQDAHEFLNYLLNKIVEEVEQQARVQPGADDLSNSVATLAPTVLTNTASTNSGTPPEDATLVHRLFEGVLTSETRCLTCETVSSRDECFLDLSIDIEQNSSVTACLRQFSASEMLCQKNKFFCDSCCELQEAEKRMKIKKLPNVLALHLKRFKYQEDQQKYVKLAYRVAFPFELRLFNTVDDMDEPDRLFNLFAIVVHIGAGPHHGHYISIIKTLGTWLVFDDDNVYPIPESEIPKYYGDSSAGSAYVLYYQAADINLEALGIQRHSPSPISAPISRFNSTSDIPSSSPNATPALPPGLMESSESDVSDSAFPLTPVQSQPPSAPDRAKPTRIAPVDIMIPSANEDKPPGSPVPETPTRPSTSKGKGLFSTLRRAPSSQPRPSTSTGVVRRPSLADAGVPPPPPPVPAMSPSRETAHEDEGDEEEETVDSHALESQTAALPTLTKVDNTPTSPQPQPRPAPKLENGKPKDHDLKEPTRKTSTWFGKRRSHRPGEEKQKRPETAYATLPSSETPPHSSNWFWNAAPRAKTRRGSDAGFMDESAFDALGAGKRSKSPSEMPLAGGNAMRSATSSAGSLSGQHSLSSGSSQRDRERNHHPPPPVYTHQPPPRMSSLVSPPTSPESPSRTFHKQSLSNLKPLKHKDKSKGPPPGDSPRRPATAGGAGTKHRELDRPLPPVPSLPHNHHTHTNGHAFPDDLVLDIRAASSETARSQDATAPLVGPAHSHASVGATSTSTTSSSGSGFKRATRKLSLTAPLRNLGRKKHKDEGPPSAYAR